ncbi:LPS export ABC transporter periplasmic protein LptC [Alphaproteobacteria bacterium]|nr:LPS export ABC transporter periplasmic protein LptC [Alphaproteobacteria bacterium]|tara:strand:- start:1196 stop:1774 length:579 start_codon:yes stop_codon:yes gene_type:complete
MFRVINKKFIFASLIMTIVLIFIINIFLSEVFKTTDKAIVKAKKENSEKISGVRIHQKSKRGEKFLIVAETLKESKTEANKVILENSLTTIDKNGILTKIVAGHAIVSNNYENFNFSEKVKVIKKSRNFVLETKTLVGTFKKGNFSSVDKVKIISGNTKINGNGLDFRKNGEYIRIKGKAVLTMLLSSKNET